MNSPPIDVENGEGTTTEFVSPADPNFNFEAVITALAAEQKKTGWVLPRQTVSWRKLTVSVAKNDEIISTCGSTLKGMLLGLPAALYRKATRQSPARHELISDISGTVNPGEVLLVLGPPGSGCTTLLKALTGQTNHLQVEGDIFFNGESPGDGKNHFERNYVLEEDIHHATLTVKETLMLALETSIPLEYPNRGARLQLYLEIMLHVFGLTAIQESIVGNNLLRGISGGEKRRLTIAELLVNVSTQLVCLDGWSTGLDSAAALDILKAIRGCVKITRTGTIISQYQCSEDIFGLCDKLLLLKDGKQVYFGPAAEARNYFFGLGIPCPPNRTTPDFLATVTDTMLRTLKEDDKASKATEDSATSGGGGGGGSRPSSPGEPMLVQPAPAMDNDLPSTVPEFVQAFARSDLYQQMELQLQEASFLARDPANSSLEGLCPEAVKALHTKEYKTPFGHQLKQCAIVEKNLVRNSVKTTVVPRVASHIILGLFLGAIFFGLDEDAQGANSRAGVIFQAMTFLGLASFGLIPAMVDSRKVFYKHRRAKMYHPMAWFVSQTIADFPISVAETLAFLCVLYWMVGLHPTFLAFMYAIVVSWLIKQVLSNIIRLFTVLMPDAPSAQAGVAGAVLLMVFYSGFMVHSDDVFPLWAWVPYISPIAYGYHGLAVNEFQHLEFKCTPDEWVPPAEILRPYMGTATNITAYQVCPIPGESSGARTGLGYLKARFGITGEDLLWLDIVILIVLLIVVFVLALLAVLFVDHASPTHSMVFKKRKRQLIQPNNADNPPPSRPLDDLKPAYFTWSGVFYTVPKPKAAREHKNDKDLTLLRDVCGYCKPGMLCALMGSSGAGKTTLLDVLAKRKTGGVIQGDIALNGAPLDTNFVRFSGYVEQQDIHNPTMTVEEALMFSAKLRLPSGTSTEVLDESVQRTLQTLNLTSYRDAVIGSLQTSGIPLHARKRVTIGVELVANPSLLFLDEPTSGLDTAGALTVMKTIRRIAKSGRAVICTIHQPSAEIFSTFDYMLLLARGGRTVYFGPVNRLVSFFQDNGAAAIQPSENPAEYMLEVIGAGIQKRETVADWPDVWKNSDQARSLRDLFEQKAIVPTSTEAFVPSDRSRPSLWTQFWVVLMRSFTTYWRTPSYNVSRCIVAAGMAFIFGTSFFDLGNTQVDLFAFVTAVFFSVFNFAMPMMDSATYLFTEREYFYHETAAGTYRPVVYALTSAIVEIPYIIVSASTFFLIFYWMVGFAAGDFWYTYLLYLIFNSIGVYLGQFTSSLCSAVEIAMQVLPLLLNIWLLSAGFFITEEAMPVYMIPLNVFNPFRYYLRAFLTNAFHGKQFICEDDELIQTAVPPKGCPDLPFIIHDTTANLCKICPQSGGDTFLNVFYDWSYDTHWTDLLVLVGALFVLRAVTSVVLTFLRHMNR